MRNFLRNEKGVGLVGTMMALVILGIITVGIMRVLNTSVKNQNAIQARESVRRVHREITKFLSNEKNCYINFVKSRSLFRPVQDFKLPLDVRRLPAQLSQLEYRKMKDLRDKMTYQDVKFKVGDIYDRGAIQLTKMDVKNLKPRGYPPTNRAIVDLVVTLEAVKQANGPHYYIRRIPLNVILSAAIPGYKQKNPPVVLSCAATEDELPQVWQKEPNGNIYYKGGSIGINSDGGNYVFQAEGLSDHDGIVLKSKKSSSLILAKGRKKGLVQFDGDRMTLDGGESKIILNQGQIEVDTSLNVDGAIKAVGDTLCSLSSEGAVTYSPTKKALQYCSGGSWVMISGANETISGLDCKTSSGRGSASCSSGSSITGCETDCPGGSVETNTGSNSCQLRNCSSSSKTVRAICCRLGFTSVDGN